MRMFLVSAVLLAVLVVGVSGCVKVDVPEGPYVVAGDDGKAAPTVNSINDVRALLKRARADGEITDTQYKILCDRVERELKK